MTSQPVHVIYLYHPGANAGPSTLPGALIKRIENLYQGSFVQTAHIRYGYLNTSAKNTRNKQESHVIDCCLADSSALSVTPFSPVSSSPAESKQFQSLGHDTSLLDAIRKPKGQTLQDVIDQLLDNDKSTKLGCLADGLVACVEVRFTIAVLMCILLSDSNTSLLYPFSALQSSYTSDLTTIGEIYHTPSTRFSGIGYVRQLISSF